MHVIEVLSYLINRGASINTSDMNGVTPLHWSVLNGHINCCRILLANGAEVNCMTKSEDRDTPLDYAMLNNHSELAEFLLGHNAVPASKILNIASSIIQSAWRQHKSGQRANIPRLRPVVRYYTIKEKTMAAIRIQKTYRGFLSRKLYRKLRREMAATQKDYRQTTLDRFIKGSKPKSQQSDRAVTIMPRNTVKHEEIGTNDVSAHSQKVRLKSRESRDHKRSSKK